MTDTYILIHEYICIYIYVSVGIYVCDDIYDNLLVMEDVCFLYHSSALRFHYVY